MPSSDELFAAVLIEGAKASIESWVSTGPGIVTQLRDELMGRTRVELPPGSSFKAMLDNLTAAALAAAEAHPDVFLQVFAAERWEKSPTVCTGLGAIKRPEATIRLIRCLSNPDRWVRVSAAAALRGHHHPDLEPALRAALDDEEDLVTWHVQQRLDELTRPI